MANICDNTFYALSEDPENILVIVEFFKDWPSANCEADEDTVDCWFESRWTFPRNEMNELLKLIPNKDDIYMRCLSVEYGNEYVALHTTNGDGWIDKTCG